MTSLGPSTEAVETRSRLPVISAQDDYFQKLVTDYTWQNSFNLTFNPSSVVDSHLISFEIPRMSSPNFVCLNDLAVQLLLRLVDKDGNKVEDNKIVAPCNLFTAALFRYILIFHLGGNTVFKKMCYLQVLPCLCPRSGGLIQPGRFVPSSGLQ